MPVKEIEVDLSTPKGIFTQLDLPSKRGRVFAILINKDTCSNNKVRIDSEYSIKHSADCVQYFVFGAEDNVIGSFFSVSGKKTEINENFILVRDSSEDTKFKSQLEKDSGGVIVYRDEQNSLVIIPGDPAVNDLLTVD